MIVDTSNIVLIASENITKIDFYITTQKELPIPIRELLKTKPSAVMPTHTSLVTPSVKLYYISDNKFQVSIDGFFPMIGKYMKVMEK